MKRLRKTIAILTLVSVVYSVGGCSLFDDGSEAVLKAAEEYAEAVADADVDALEDILFDGEECAGILEEYMHGGGSLLPESYEEICAAIAGSITYEIDSDSLQVSKKDGKASVDITFEMVDYEAAYEEVGQTDFDAFMDMLTAADDTVEVSKTIDFVLEDGVWLVKDKKCRDLKKIYAFYEDALEYVFVDESAVLAATEAYAEAVVSFDVDAIFACLSYSDCDQVDELTLFVDHDPDMWGSDYDVLCSLIEGTFTYEIYPDTLEVVSDNVAMVQISFGMVDYEDIEYMVDDGLSADEIVRQLSDPDIGEIWIPLTLTLCRVDGQWYVENDGMGSLYDLEDVYWFYVDLIDYGVFG